MPQRLNLQLASLFGALTTCAALGCAAVAPEDRRAAIEASKAQADNEGVRTITTQITPGRPISQKRSALKECANAASNNLPNAEALALCDVAVAEGQADAYYYRAFIHLEGDRPRAAIEDFSLAIDRGSRYKARAYYNRGVAKEQVRSLRSACVDFKSALDLIPQWSAARLAVERCAWALAGE